MSKGDSRNPLVVQIVGLVSGVPSSFDGKYLVEYDPERDGISPDGRPMVAHIVVSSNKAEAKVFADLEEARACWAQVPKRQPVRRDGKPNRPLTAFTVTMLPFADD